jgi:hypothetical protein
MKVYVYKNGMCDPKAKLGAIKTFQKAKEVDDYLNLLCVSMTSIAHKQYRVFIANDNVDQSSIDHYIIMEDNYELDMVKKDFKEVDTRKVAVAGDAKLAEREKIIRPRVKTVRT